MISKYHQRFFSTEERFWQKVEKTETCWLWLGAKNSCGYGYFRPGNRKVPMTRAHTWAYEVLVGLVPNGLQLDHLCRVRSCVNPSHLEAVTGRENVLRSPHSHPTHCKHGHKFVEATTYVDSQGHRHCRICRVADTRRYFLKHPEKYHENNRIVRRR